MELCQSSIHSSQSSVYCTGWLVAVTIHEIAWSGYRSAPIKLYHSDVPFTHQARSHKDSSQGDAIVQRGSKNISHNTALAWAASICLFIFDSRWAAAELLFVCAISLPLTLTSTSVSCVFVVLCTLKACSFSRLKAGGTKQPYTRRSLHLRVFHCGFTFPSPGLWILNSSGKFQSKWCWWTLLNTASYRPSNPVSVTNPWCYFYCPPPPPTPVHLSFLYLCL